MLVGLGNHELDKSDDKILLARLKESQFVWIVTNTLYCKAKDDCAPFRTVAESVSELRELEPGNDVRIGVMGLLYPLQKDYARSTDVNLGGAGCSHHTHGERLRSDHRHHHQDMPDDERWCRRSPVSISSSAATIICSIRSRWA